MEDDWLAISLDMYGPKSITNRDPRHTHIQHICPAQTLARGIVVGFAPQDMTAVEALNERDARRL